MIQWYATIFVLLTGGAIGILAVGWFFSRKEKNLSGTVASLQTELADCRQQFDNEKNVLLQSFEREKELLNAGFQSRLDTERKLGEERLESARKSREEDQEHFRARLELAKEEFKNLSEKILEEKSGKMQSSNREQLEALLAPLREKMVEFKNAVEASRAKGIELNAALKTQLDKMMEETGRIGGEARSLVNALKGEQKTQGDWGEMILEDILNRSGLRRGVHYECQETLRDADGHAIISEDERRMRPDVIVHYPDGKEVIIDSKVSLTAYVSYMNSDSDETRREALAAHLKSVRTHVDELAKKNYALHLAQSGRETVDFVVMFIPNEGPFHLAMISDPALWAEAFKAKVLIVSPTNLMALLKIIQIAWSREEQTRNQQEILNTAATLMDRLYAFYSDFEEIGRNLEKAADAYNSATRRLKQGERNHSIVNSGEKLKKLGVKMTRQRNLPNRLQPELDLGLPPADPDENEFNNVESTTTED